MAKVPLCTQQELNSAFRLIVSPREADRRAREMFDLHDVDRRGYLLIDPSEWFPTVSESAIDDYSAEGFATGSIASDDEFAQSFATDSAASDAAATGWALEIRKLSDERRGEWLLAYSPLTLDLLSLVSDELMQRVQSITQLSSLQAEDRRRQMGQALRILRGR